MNCQPVLLNDSKKKQQNTFQVHLTGSQATLCVPAQSTYFFMYPYEHTMLWNVKKYVFLAGKEQPVRGN